MEAAKRTALMLTGMLFFPSLGRHRRLSGTLTYIFLCRTQLTTIPQRPSTRHDLNGQWRLPWCLTPSAAALNGHPACWLIIVCGGAKIGATWRPWDDSNHHGWWGTVTRMLWRCIIARTKERFEGHTYPQPSPKLYPLAWGVVIHLFDTLAWSARPHVGC
jgi:hypothetical protein